MTVNAVPDNLHLELDDDIRVELYDAFSDLSADVEQTLSKLKYSDSQEDLNSLFRHIHTIKGNAAIVQVAPVVDYTHCMEEVMSSVRARKFDMSPLLSEVIQVGVDRLRDLHLRELFNHTFENLHEVELAQYFSNLAHAHPKEVDQICRDILDFISHGIATTEPTVELSPEEERLVCYTAPVNLSKQKFDLIFFRDVASRVDQQNSYWKGRSEQVHEWTLKMNAIRDSKIDPIQLSAAAFMHDVGMTFIPSQILAKSAPLTEEEIELVRQHPIHGYNFLIRMPGWDEAATIVLEHHERVDGTGYPCGNKGHIVHEGAKIISIIEAFFSIINGRADRAHRKSIVRAVSEINSRIGTQFDEYWVEAFNDMLRLELRSGKL